MAFVRFKPPQERPRRDSEFPSVSRPRVLYVEDEDINWEIAQNELEDRFSLVRARSAREAFSLIARNTFHLILLDIQLRSSEIDGLEIARLLKGKSMRTPPEYAAGVRASTPIIFVTANTARYPAEELLSAGGADVISKPVNFTRLSLAIARVWARGSIPDS
jgi:CheY-like chemotaxis protein